MPDSEQGPTPPNGWASLDAEEARKALGQLRDLVGLLGSLREVLPEDLQGQLTDLVRQILVVARVLIDLLVERLEQGERPKDRAAGTEVQDIPIL